MAYIREAWIACARCRSMATHEVFDRANAPCGKYCKLHAELKLRELQASERESDKALGER